MLYRLTIEPQGPCGTPIRSDILFGHACWSVLFSDGESRLKEFIEAARAGSPEIVFSDAFPENHLPRPILPSAVRKPSGLQQARDEKTVRKAKWVSLQDAGAGKWEPSIEKVKSPSYANYPAQRDILRNVIDRQSGTARERAGLYTVEETWYDGIWRRLDVYVETSYDAVRLQNFIDDMLQAGFGRDRTVGMGAVKRVAGPVAANLPHAGTSTVFLSLSRCIPDGSIDVERSWYTIEAKYGKAWSELNASTPFKTGILLTVPGSVFCARERKKLYGRVIDCIIPGTSVIENCMTIPLFLAEEVVAHENL